MATIEREQPPGVNANSPRGERGQVLECTRDRIAREQPVSANNGVQRLVEVQTRWLSHERRRRQLSNERIRTVNDARDAGMSLGEIARAMSSAGKPVTKDAVVRILACGYPSDEEPGPVEAA